MTEENEFQTNRFTSFYHPPFQLLLPAMSADAYCKLYFLVNDDPGVRSVRTYADWDINDLKKAIIHEAGLNLRTSDIILRKVRIFFLPAYTSLLTCHCSYAIPLKSNLLRLLPIGFRPQSQIPPLC